ncbi:hypothetical protein Y032_0054g2461 [Ancylostoma ceylanicum]|uniref:Uncharacterized protein n=1 Tax=Ancylostoma ceylanicum TaxID=53326 RepID=A0A016U638_9BILA|nr:hypothetical protein Y032_0054g2461 [Ancylostoma ceylanicum]
MTSPRTIPGTKKFEQSAASASSFWKILILSGIQDKPAPVMADAWLSCLFAYLSTRYRRLREEGHYVTRPKSAKKPVAVECKEAC